jgi:hypothetical protein
MKCLIHRRIVIEPLEWKKIDELPVSRFLNGTPYGIEVHTITSASPLITVAARILFHREISDRTIRTYYENFRRPQNSVTLAY